MTTSDEDGNENDTRLSQVPQVRIIREEQQRGLIHLHVLCPQVMHFVNRILHIQAAAQPPTPADKLAKWLMRRSISGRGRPQLFELLPQPQV